jgi:hypothetical protein
MYSAREQLSPPKTFGFAEILNCDSVRQVTVHGPKMVFR